MTTSKKQSCLVRVVSFLVLVGGGLLLARLAWRLILQLPPVYEQIQPADRLGLCIIAAAALHAIIRKRAVR